MLMLVKCQATTSHQSNLNVPMSHFYKFLELYWRDEHHCSLSLCFDDGGEEHQNPPYTPQNMIYVFFVLIAPFSESLCSMDGGGIILDRTTPIRIKHASL